LNFWTAPSRFLANIPREVEARVARPFDAGLDRPGNKNRDRTTERVSSSSWKIIRKTGAVVLEKRPGMSSRFVGDPDNLLETRHASNQS
jgi:hypothetical protein